MLEVSSTLVVVVASVVAITLVVVCVVVVIGTVVVVVEGAAVVVVGLEVLTVVTLFVVGCNVVMLAVVVVDTNGVVVPPQIAHPVQSPHCEVSISHDACIVYSTGHLSSEPKMRKNRCAARNARQVVHTIPSGIISACSSHVRGLSGGPHTAGQEEVVYATTTHEAKQ